MAEVVLFHHAHGLTPGVGSFADRLREGGHVVYTPDLYDGLTFEVLDDGVRHAEQVVGIDPLIERGRAAAEGLGERLVYAGFSLGAIVAQGLAQTRPAARGALLFAGCAPAAAFGGPWPAGVRLQIHAMESDPWVELDVALALADAVDGAELFLYPGERHLFADDGLPDYDDVAAALAAERALAMLEAVG